MEATAHTTTTSAYSLVPPARRTADRSLRHMKFVLSSEINKERSEFFTEFVMARGGVVIHEDVARRLLKEAADESEHVAYIVSTESGLDAGNAVVAGWVGEETERCLPRVLAEATILSMKDCALLKGRGSSNCYSVTMQLYRNDTYPRKSRLGLSKKGIEKKLAIMESTFDDWDEEVLKNDVTAYINLGPGIPCGRDPADFPTIDPIPITVTSRKRRDVSKELLTKFAGIFDDESVLHRFWLQMKDKVEGLTESKDQAASLHDVSSISYSVDTKTYHFGYSVFFQLPPNLGDSDDENNNEDMCGDIPEVDGQASEIHFITDPRPRPLGALYDSDEEEEPWPYAGYSYAYLRPNGDAQYLKNRDEVVISTNTIRVMFDRWMPDGIGVVRTVNAPDGMSHFTRLGLLQALVDTCAEVNPELVAENMALNAVWLQEDGIYYQRIE